MKLKYASSAVSAHHCNTGFHTRAITVTLELFMFFTELYLALMWD